MKTALFIPAFLAAAALASAVQAGAVQAQAYPWQARPDDPAWQAERLRLERERWRTGLELRNLQADADQRRTESVISGIRAQRGPAVAPPPSGTIYLGPVDPALVNPDPGAARERRETLSQGLSGIDAFLDRTRPD
jgi:hypothetical protein